MRKTTTLKKDNLNYNWIDDHGKMGWVGKSPNRKSFITTIWQHIREEWLVKEYKRGDGRCTLEMND